MMKIVYFKNGMTIEISQENANTIMKNLVDGCGNFQCFCIDSNVDFMINLSEVVKIQ